LCAGRDEMSSEEEEDERESEKSRYEGHHRFAQPDDIKFKLEAGAIPDAAMIHAARKRRQKAREEGKKNEFEIKIVL
jgi:GC-rich sequence DNA-binding factor